MFDEFLHVHYEILDRHTKDGLQADLLEHHYVLAGNQ
jgi:hypothetical protein